jgi:hypothetical protein
MHYATGSVVEVSVSADRTLRAIVLERVANMGDGRPGFVGAVPFAERDGAFVCAPMLGFDADIVRVFTPPTVAATN